MYNVIVLLAVWISEIAYFNVYGTRFRKARDYPNNCLKSDYIEIVKGCNFTVCLILWGFTLVYDASVTSCQRHVEEASWQKLLTGNTTQPSTAVCLPTAARPILPCKTDVPFSVDTP